MALLLARRQRRFPSAPSPILRFFSNSSSDPPPNAANASTQSPNRESSRLSSDNNSRRSLQDLSTKLAKFQRRSAAPPPTNAPISISFETLYKHNKVASNASDRINRRGREMMSEGRSREGEETEETEFLKIYKEDELGEKLRMLRPEGKKKKEEEGWFSLEELSERLVKLRQVEEREVKKNHQRGSFSVLRNVIGTLEDGKAKNDAVSLQSLDFLGCLDGTPEYKHYPPKDELVETYFHSDNLSSAEKMKIELTQVREDFKMSESDCGSARVQVAQLTTKIKHLTSALHKKDKHSRNGLVAMVQKRKKLLKYLRRTDWDSYCLVLSNLGLRDNPDYKIPDYTKV